MGEQQAQTSVALWILAGSCSLGLSLLPARSQHCHTSPATSTSWSQTSSPLSQLPLALALPGGFPGDPSNLVQKQGKGTSPPEAAGEEDFCLARVNNFKGETRKEKQLTLKRESQAPGTAAAICPCEPSSREITPSPPPSHTWVLTMVLTAASNSSELL